MADAAAQAFKPGGHDHALCIDDAFAAAQRICDERGLRFTPLRRRVLEIVWEQHNPVGAYEILDRLRSERGRAAPPTVYRALDFLLECGLVHRIHSLNAFIGCPDPQAAHSGQFLICRGCRTVGELGDREIEGMVAGRAETLGFSVEGQTIELLGLCPSCRDDGDSRDAA
ncbi:MAG: Fur family transcriptional regulator [Defluviicoccus sp.]|nr:Fur family transcriptional regulator [Defluviicoccus sp.]MDE0275476.1 Fur family transcriptional regulator [Defluviicoccus sp.]